MKTKIIHPILALLLLFLSSCSKEDDTTNKGANQQLTSVEISNDSDQTYTFKINYLYDSQKRLTTINAGAEIIFEFTYIENSISKIKIIEENVFTNYTYFYNDNKLIPSRIVATGKNDFDINYVVTDSKVQWKNKLLDECLITITNGNVIESIVNGKSIKLTYSDANEVFSGNEQSIQLLLAMALDSSKYSSYVFDAFSGIQTSKNTLQRLEQESNGTILNFTISKNKYGYVDHKTLANNSSTTTIKYNYK